MKVKSLLALLNNFESAVVLIAGSGARGVFAEFPDLFYDHEDESLATFVNKLIKQRDIHGRGTNTRPIANLREALSKLVQLLRSAEAQKAANEVEKLVELLEWCGHASIGAFVSDARGWLEPKTKRSQKPLAPKVAAPRLSPNDYAVLLKQMATKSGEFDQVIERLRSDRKNIKTPEMRDIARLFLDRELPKKAGREAALTAIIERQRVDARQDARASLIDRLKAW